MSDSDNVYELSPEDSRAVREIMDLGGFQSPERAVQQSLADSRYMLRKRWQGWQVLLRRSRRILGGTRYREVYWNDRLGNG